MNQALKKKSEKPHDKIKDYLEAFYESITKIIEDMEKKIKECEGEYEKTAKFFCESSKDPSEKFAEKFLKLWNSCKTCKKELEKLKLQAKKEAEKKAKEGEKKAIEDKKNLAKAVGESKTLPNANNVKAIPG